MSPRVALALALAGVLLLVGRPGVGPAGAQSMPNRAAEYRGGEQPWLRCGVEQALDVDLDGPGRPYHAEWRRCGPRRAEWKPDGKTIDYPVHWVVVTEVGTAAPAVVFDNHEEPGLTYIARVQTRRFTADGRRQLLVVGGVYGTGAGWDLCVLGRVRGSLACWALPDLGSVIAPLMAADEESWKSVLDTGSEDRVRVEALIYDRKRDPNCCPSRGSIFVELLPADGRLEPGRLWRAPGKASR